MYKNSWTFAEGGRGFHRPRGEEFRRSRGHDTLHADSTSACACAAEMANSLDMDALLDEVIARKGAYKYQDGFSEENWEEVT